jgi:glyoxylase-like metal-dependent hydrolase (beta-lactamase superfamily II)
MESGDLKIVDGECSPLAFNAIGADAKYAAFLPPQRFSLMYEEILPNLFRIKIPLPDSPLRYLNSYIIKDSARSLIVDTGLNHKACLEAMQRGLNSLGIDLAKSDIFLTHRHIDHFGLVAKLVSDSTRIFIGRPDKILLESWKGIGTIAAYARQNGFPENELKAVFDKHPATQFDLDWVNKLSAVDDGDVLKFGGYHFRCVATPGHTIGHTCLYEPTKKILLAGDHILMDITPNIVCWSDAENPLKLFLASLDKIDQLKVDHVLPGHRRLIDRPKERIEELRKHHARRLEEVLSILDGSSMTAFQTASNMTWDFVSESWDQFPATQKWFATGEAISHLRYLQKAGTIIQKTENKIIKFDIRK